MFTSGPHGVGAAGATVPVQNPVFGEPVSKFSKSPVTRSRQLIDQTSYPDRTSSKSMTGAEFTIVLYKGTGPLTNDLVGGHVAVGFNTIPAARSNIEAGNLHAIAVAAHARSAALPDVPTAAESGLPGFEATFYYGLSAPAGTPRPIIERLNTELRSMIESEEMTKQIVADGGDPITSTPDEYAANIEREEGKWAALIKKLGLKIE